jgi:small neutral amino acid transporter SnatA (MarC family)
MAPARRRLTEMELQILPLAVTMMAGPQIMTAVIFVTHPRPVRVSVAFLGGVAAAAILGTTLYYLLAGAVGDLGDPADTGAAGTVIQLALVALLLVLAVRTYLNRETAEPPKWLGGLLDASPRKALTMGFLLIFVMPTDIATMLTVGVHLQQNDASLIDALPFLALTMFIAASPLLAFVVFRRRAEKAMPKVRDWMNDNSWLVNIIVLGIFVYLILA